MKSLKKVFLLLFFALIVTFSLCACDAGNSETTPGAVATATTKPSTTKAPTVAPTTAKPTVSPATTEPVPTETPNPAPTEKPFDNLFEVLPDEFTFLSGAGAWQTVLTIADDGSFIGKYTDSDMGIYDDDYYPDGTVYICNFKGKFTKPEKVSDFIYSMHLESLEAEGTPGDVYYENDKRYIISKPYGLVSADELYIYLPGMPIAELPEEFLSWVHLNESVGDTMPIGLYGIYNIAGKDGFSGEDETYIWNNEYTYNYEGREVLLSPSYWYTSDLELKGKDGETVIDLRFTWKDERKFEVEVPDKNGSGTYLITIEYGEDASSMSLTVKSLNGTDLSAWGGTKNGYFKAEMAGDIWWKDLFVE